MRTRRLITLMLGIWLGCSVFMMFVAIQNFAGVDRLLSAPPEPVSKWIGQLGHDNTRMMLRYQASEQNRLFFSCWDWVQVALGVILTGVIFFSPRAGRPALILAGLMLVIAVSQATLMTPRIIGLGRVIDFAPQALETPERAEFWRLHRFYSGLEVFKLVLGLGLSVLFVWDRRDSLRLRKVNPVDHAHHSHINR